MTDVVKVDKDGQVATVTLNRPDKLNAANFELLAALDEAGKQLGADRSVRAIVLTGEGRSFCSGLDLSAIQQGDAAELPAKLVPGSDSPANFFQRAAIVWREIPQPVICAIQGAAVGAGLQIAMGADLRYASSDCQLSVMEIKWGIIPDMGISQTMKGILATDKVKELAWTGRTVEAVEALRLGLVSAIVDDPRATALETATSIAARSPDAIRAIKRLFVESPGLSAADALRLEAELQMPLLGSRNQLEAVAANMEKRAPEFKD